MLKMKLKPIVPKKVKLVRSLHIWNFLQMRDWLKYSWGGGVIKQVMDTTQKVWTSFCPQMGKPLTNVIKMKDFCRK